jgi:16S rRNA processing protein RimM
MDKIYVAKLGKAVGLKGQIRLFIESDFPEQFSKGATFTTNKNKTLQIESINNTKDLIKFNEIDSIEEAKKLTNTLLFTSYEDSVENCKLDKDQFFWFDIIGCQIKENGKVLGIVEDVQRLPLDDYLIIKTDDGLLELNDKAAKTFMLPYNHNFIVNVDIDKKMILTQNSFDIFEAS